MQMPKFLRKKVAFSFVESTIFTTFASSIDELESGTNEIKIPKANQKQKDFYRSSTEAQWELPRSCLLLEIDLLPTLIHLFST